MQRRYWTILNFKVSYYKCQKDTHLFTKKVIGETNIWYKATKGKIEKVPRVIRGEKSSKDMASSRNLVSTIGALASPKMGDGTRCPEG